MGRDLRFIPPGGALVEVTCRCFQGRFLLRPSVRLNEIAIGTLARAAALYKMALIDFKFLSNHYHLLVAPDNARQLAEFMRHLNSKLAREVGRLHRWREKVFGRRYRAIVVSDEPEAQEARLRYLLEQGVKEGLVDSPRRWPGATGTASLLTGRPARGRWFNRSAEYRARRADKTSSRYQFATEEALELAPLPCWNTLSPQEYRRRVKQMVHEIERAAQETAAATGRTCLGRRRVLKQDPHDQPARSERSAAPRFHAATTLARRLLETAYRAFLGSYREAAEALRRGATATAFPAGAFPPPAPFVPAPP